MTDAELMLDRALLLDDEPGADGVWPRYDGFGRHYQPITTVDPVSTATITPTGVEYDAYLHSPEWKATRLEAIRRAGGKCQVCGHQPGKGQGLEVHHNTYERLGKELPTDMCVLCQRCHRIFHRHMHIRPKRQKKPLHGGVLMWCDRCGKQMRIIHGTFGQFLGCSGFPKCREKAKLTFALADELGIRLAT